MAKGIKVGNPSRRMKLEEGRTRATASQTSLKVKTKGARPIVPKPTEENIEQNGVPNVDPLDGSGLYQPQTTRATHPEVEDIVLDFSAVAGNENAMPYRAPSALLRERSSYFRSLLDPGFGEGAEVKRKQQELQQAGFGRQSLGIPDDRLPSLQIQDVGVLPAGCDIRAVIQKFLLLAFESDPVITLRGIVDLGSILIMADRFNMVTHVRAELFKHDALRILASPLKPDNEERLRLRLLAGILQKDDRAIFTCSSKLVIRGSTFWKGGDLMQSENEVLALWKHLPHGYEEELSFRRQCILNTIQTIQNDILSDYLTPQTAGTQCKLGYENSSQCDSFQLGQMIKFFGRVGTLRLQPLLTPTDEPEDRNVNIEEIITTLRSCPEYQIDRHHRHCGLRAKLLPALEFVQRLIASAGVCGECWTADIKGHSWQHASSRMHWRMGMERMGQAAFTGKESHAHEAAKKVFAFGMEDNIAGDI